MVYDNEPLSYPGHSDKNSFKLVKKPYMECYSSYIKVSKGAKIRNRYNQVPHLLSTFTKLQGCKQPFKLKKKCHIFFGNYLIFLGRLKDSTQIERKCVKTFDVRHSAKHYRATQERKCNFSA